MKAVHVQDSSRAADGYDDDEEFKNFNYMVKHIELEITGPSNTKPGQCITSDLNVLSVDE